MKVLVEMPDALVARIDAAAGKGRRAAWLREAAELRLDSNSRAFRVETPPAGGRRVLSGQVRTSHEAKAGIKPISRD